MPLVQSTTAVFIRAMSPSFDGSPTCDQVTKREEVFPNLYRLYGIEIDPLEKEKLTMLRPICFHKLLAGTLSADETFTFLFPFDVQLIHIAAMASNDSDATLSVGTTGSAAAHMAATTIGDSGTMKELNRDDFVNSQFPHIAAGTVILATLDHDGSSGTAAQNVEIQFTFVEG